LFRCETKNNELPVVDRTMNTTSSPLPQRRWPGATRFLIGLAILAVAVVAFLLGFGLARSRHQTGPVSTLSASGESAPTRYACAMMCIPPVEHAGKCPVCGMEMVPVESDAEDRGADPASVRLSPAASELAAVELATVERRPAQIDLRLFGRVALDETRVRTVTAAVSGRPDRIYVAYTGVRVREGDPLIWLYTPELLPLQDELIRAAQDVWESKATGIEAMREPSLQALEVARSRLLAWGLTPEQLVEIEWRRTPSDHITVFAPIEGVVLETYAQEGVHIEMGDRLFMIADLSVVWVEVEAYEADLPWIRYGQEVAFETDALPGEVFKGRIALVDPMVDPKTRTVKVLANVPNEGGRLKPGTFVRGRVRVRAGDNGVVYAPELAGKWICSLHPEIMKAASATCDVCGLALVTTESLGYVTDETASRPPVVIPASAVLLTGKRALVYVATGDATFTPREVELGPRAGDSYIVRSGLKVDERVAARGALRIDSAAQIMSRPSMMQPATASPVEATSPQRRFGSADRELQDKLLTAYFKLEQALAGDQLERARTAAATLRAAAGADSGVAFTRTIDPEWSQIVAWVTTESEAIAKARDIATARRHFEPLSVALIRSVRTFGAPGETALHVYHCPMAFDDRGADWLQDKSGLLNPYFGAEMLTCGVLKETLQPPNSEGRN
jgi:Cu(I)/Ag(I) efflux system membrane fusion protein